MNIKEWKEWVTSNMKRSKVWRQVKMQKKQHTNFEQEEDIFMGDKDLSSEKKMSEYAPSSKNHIQRQQHSVL